MKLSYRLLVCIFSMFFSLTVQSFNERNATLTRHSESVATVSPTVESAESLLLGSYEAGYFLLLEGEGAQFLTEGVQILEKIVAEFPDSPQAVSAALALGNSQLFMGNYQKAIPLLETARQHSVSLYDTVHTHIALYKSYTGLEKTEEAEMLLQELKEIISSKFCEFKPFVNTIFIKKDLPILFKSESTPQIEEHILCKKVCSQEASYNASTGQIHIPCIKALDAVGNITVYEVILNQREPSWVFDLDVNSIKAHQ